MLNALPVRRWHAWQWQIDTANGSAVVVTRSWPQWQLASRGSVIAPTLTGLPVTVVTPDRERLQDKVTTGAGGMGIG
jgi:hypothetical protein